MADDGNYDHQKWDDSDEGIPGKTKTPPKTDPIPENDHEHQEKSEEMKTARETDSPTAKTSKKKKRRKKKKRSKSKTVREHHRRFDNESMEVAGETLGSCSLEEWETAYAASDPTLINLKRKPNRVTVFAKTKKVQKNDKATKTDSATGLLSVEPENIKLGSVPVATKAKTEDHADRIGRLVAGIVRKFMEGKSDENIQLEIRLVSADGSSIPVVP